MTSPSVNKASSKSYRIKKVKLVSICLRHNKNNPIQNIFKKWTEK